MSQLSHEKHDTATVDLIAIVGAMVAVLGLFSVFMDVVSSGNATRNAILGIGQEAVSDPMHAQVLKTDWMTFWIGSSLACILFGLLFAGVLAWERARKPRQFRLGGVGVLALGLVALIFLAAGIGHFYVGLTSDLPAINKTVALHHP